MLGRAIRYAALLGLLIAVLAVKRSANPESPLQESVRLQQDAAKLLEAGRYPSGISIARRALELREAALGSEHSDIPPSLDVLGALYQGAGTLDLAQAMRSRAFTLRERALGPEHPDTAAALVKLADVYLAAGEWSKAEPHYQRALAALEKTVGTEHIHTAEALLGLATLYTETAAYDRAEPLYRRTLGIRERISGPESAHAAVALNRMAGMQRHKGDYALAQALYERALVIREKINGPQHLETARALANLAIVHTDAGNYLDAESMFQRSLAILESTVGAEHPLTGLLATNFASLYILTGSYGPAETLLHRAIATQRTAQGALIDLSLSLQNLATLYSDLGRYEEAVPLASESLDIAAGVLGADHPDAIFIASTLGMLYRRLGAYDKAEPLLMRSVQSGAKAGARADPITAIHLGDLYMDRGAYRDAESLYRRAIALAEGLTGPENIDAVIGLRALAILHWARGEVQQALSLLQRVQDLRNLRSERFLTAGSATRKQDYLRTFTEDTFDDVSFTMAAPGAATTALSLTSVLQHKGRVLDAMSDTTARLRRSLTPADQSLLEQLADVVRQLSMLTYGRSSNLSSQQRRERSAQLWRLQEQLEAKLASRSRAFSREVRPVTLANVQQAIPANGVLIELLRYTPLDPRHRDFEKRRGPPRYVAYVLKHAGDAAAVDLGPAQALETLVRRLLVSLANPASTDVKQHAAALSAQLLQPLREHLRGVGHILFSPDGELNLVPLAALLDESGDYLIEHFDVSYLTSGRDLLRFSDDSKPLATSMVMANPDYGRRRAARALDGRAILQRSADLDRSGLVFRPLVSTALEAEDLKALLKLSDADVFLQEAASESRLKRVSGPRILHVATHGFFLDGQQSTQDLRRRRGAASQQFTRIENPLLRSGIALAGANARSSGQDDGILTALEVTQLDLNGTELVVLSACDSAVGEVHNGDGVYGLRRALSLAGAQTQVSSLWKVADHGTRHLMVDYYRHLLQHEGRSAALRRTQRAMLAGTTFSHPYYWASFIAIGNWNPLPPG